MSKLSLPSLVGSLIYDFRWKKSEVSIKWKLSQVKDAMPIPFNIQLKVLFQK